MVDSNFRNLKFLDSQQRDRALTFVSRINALKEVFVISSLIKPIAELPKDSRIIELPADTRILIDPDERFLPRTDLEVVSHRAYDFNWAESDYELYLSPNMKPGGSGREIDGEKIQQELKGKNPANSYCLQRFLMEPDMFPEHLKKTADGRKLSIFFFGTEFLSKSSRMLYVGWVSWDEEQNGLSAGLRSIHNLFFDGNYVSHVALCHQVPCVNA